VGDLFPHIRKDFKEKSSIPRSLLRGFFIEKIFGKTIGSAIKNKPLKNILGHLYTMISVIILWVFFRLGMKESLNFLKELFTFNHGKETYMLLIKSMLNTQFVICLFAAVIFVFPFPRKISVSCHPNHINIIRCLLIVLLVLSICSLASNAYNPFIYFRF
jgi:alginate O-acetyltransferase complex protein AlgI